jgi:hypothetical protein
MERKRPRYFSRRYVIVTEKRIDIACICFCAHSLSLSLALMMCFILDLKEDSTYAWGKLKEQQRRAEATSSTYY